MPSYITHAFLASKVSKNPLYIFGTVIADIEHVFILREDGHNEHIGLEKLIKIIEKKPGFKYLTLGLKHHIALDNYAHKKYIIPLSKKIAKKMKIKENRAHAMFEFANANKIIKENPSFFKYFQLIVKGMPHHKIKKEYNKIISNKKFGKGYEDIIGEITINKFDVLGIRKTYNKLKKYSVLKNHKTSTKGVTNYVKAYFAVRKIVDETYFDYMIDLYDYQKKLWKNDKK